MKKNTQAYYNWVNENRQKNEENLREMNKYFNKDKISLAYNQSDVRSSIRRKERQEKETNEEFLMAEKIYKRQIEKKNRLIQEEEQNVIAQEIYKQKNNDICEKKIREGLRENCLELRDLKSKLQTAIINQTRENQINEQKIMKKIEENQKYDEDKALLRKLHKEELAALELEEQKMRESINQRKLIQQQMEDQKRRQKLLETAQRIRDKEIIDESLEKQRHEYYQSLENKRIKQQNEKDEINEFIKQRNIIKENEKLKEIEEKRKMDEFIQNIDERFKRAIEEQKYRDLQRSKLANQIGSEIRRKKIEQEEYEQLCIDLAMEQELENLKKKEKLQAQKIQEQINECKMYMIQYEKQKQKQKELSRLEEEKIKKQMIEHAERLSRLAEIEQEQNRINMEKYKRELEKQVLYRKEMFEQIRVQELRKLKIQQEKEKEIEKLIEEERRNIVIEHLLKMGPESIKFLPKGVLKEDDLNYLPENFVNILLNLNHFR